MNGRSTAQPVTKPAAPEVQTSGATTPEVADGSTCTVVVLTADALLLGQTLRSLARAPGHIHIPASVRPLFDRVGTQLAKGALAELSQVSGRSK